MRLVTAGLASLMLLVAPVAAADIIVNLPAQTPTPVPVTLEPGIYDFIPIGPSDGGNFLAWNPWGGVDGCDLDGANCEAGFLHLYYSTGALERSYFSPGRFATAQLALDHALTFTVALASGGTVDFHIEDSFYGDNLGGVSLRIVRRTTGVPDAAPAQRPTLSPSRNPFPAGSGIEFFLPSAADVRLEVFDIAGRRVTRLAEGPWAAGDHVLRWDGRDAAGARAAGGLYLLRLDVGSERLVTRIVLTP